MQYWFSCGSSDRLQHINICPRLTDVLLTLTSDSSGENLPLGDYSKEQITTTLKCI